MKSRPFTIIETNEECSIPIYEINGFGMPIYNDDNQRVIRKYQRPDQTIHTNPIRKIQKRPEEGRDVANKQKFQNIWFEKEEEDLLSAQIEVLAQELFRLLIPHQPKYRLRTRNENGKQIHTILSKAVPGFRSLDPHKPTEINDLLLKQKITGLGDILVASLLMNEIDLCYANIGTNEQNQLVKIDGGWCFFRLRQHKHPKDYEITNNILHHLPRPGSGRKFYMAENWLDSLEHRNGKTKPGQQESLKDVSLLPSFRQEINQTLLRAYLLPDDFMESLIRTYITDNALANVLCDEMLNPSQDNGLPLGRIHQLRKAAQKNECFNEYIKTDAAKKQVEIYIDYLKNFKTTGKHRPVNEAVIQSIRDNYSDLTDNFIQKNRKGLLIGLAIGTLCVASIVALRVLDIFTFGLSLPLTIGISMGIAGFFSISGTAIQSSLNRKKPFAYTASVVTESAAGIDTLAISKQLSPNPEKILTNPHTQSPSHTKPDPEVSLPHAVPEMTVQPQKIPSLLKNS